MWSKIFRWWHNCCLNATSPTAVVKNYIFHISKALKATATLFNNKAVLLNVEGLFSMAQLVFSNHCTIIMISTLWSDGNRCSKDFLWTSSVYKLRNHELLNHGLVQWHKRPVETILLIERSLWLWSWATVGLCCQREKTTQCETKNTVGSNSFE